MKRLLLFVRANVLLLFIGLAASSFVLAQEAERPRKDLIGITGEYTGRRNITKMVPPLYPEEALRNGVEGIVEIRIGLTEEGKLVKIKAPPDINPLFKKAVAVAVKQWEFGPFSGEARDVITTFRLTFKFSIEDGIGRAELYNPPEGSKGAKRMLDYGKFADWENWVDITDEN
ncbi:MAG: energy transducer TonB [Acidobacteria bacterium]|nr:energy transducer TonB [Acidobacteriota bacterium]